MKALGIADRASTTRFVSQQIHYTLNAREAEYELLPIAVDQGIGTLIWSPLAGGLLSGKYRRGTQDHPDGRYGRGWDELPIRDENVLYDIIDVLVDIARQRETSVSQIALAWLLGRPSVASLVIGARTEEQLLSNLNAEIGRAHV